MPTWLGTQRKLTILLSILRRYIKDLIMRTRGDIKEWKESCKIARRYDCESEMMTTLRNSREKMNCRALIMA